MMTSQSALYSVRLLLVLLFGGVPASCLAQNPLRLPDPTPRERDPHAVFGTDLPGHSAPPLTPAMQARQIHAHVEAQVDAIIILTRHLHERVRDHDPAGLGTPNAMTADAIEKLAKRVKEECTGQ